MEFNVSNTTTTQLNSGLPKYSVSSKALVEAGAQEETYSTNCQYWPQRLGYYKQIPELKQAVDSLALWVAGKGWTCELDDDTITLEGINGWGEDTFDSLMQQAIFLKKIQGEAYFEIIRNEGELINLKPISPGRMRNVVNPKGLLIAYEELDTKEGKPIRRYKTNEIFHIVNNRVANEIQGTSVIESCQWIIDARNEAMSDLRRILHRSTIRVLYVDMDDTSKIGVVRQQYQEAIKNGEVLILPGKPQENAFQDLQVPPTQAYLEWIRYLENVFYQAVGIPKIILGGSQEFTEASSKVGYLTFEQVYAAEQRLLEQDLWNQLGIRIKFERPVSLKEDVLTSEAANTGQVGFQPNETQATMSRTE